MARQDKAWIQSHGPERHGQACCGEAWSRFLERLGTERDGSVRRGRTWSRDEAGHRMAGRGSERYGVDSRHGKAEVGLVRSGVAWTRA